MFFFLFISGDTSWLMLALAWYAYTTRPHEYSCSRQWGTYIKSHTHSARGITQKL